ncbi:MAG TPA: hypothetical protein VGI84_05625 [Pseudonocardiaceae bacterium]|jgi:hypothetical protein
MTRQATRPSRIKQAATGVSAGVVAMLDAVSAYFVVMAWLTPRPSGPGDTDAIDGARWGSSLGVLVACVDLLFGALVVRGGLLRWPWLSWPAVVLVAGVVRFQMVPRF